jgi:dimethylhistidine N-methyltransferase
LRHLRPAVYVPVDISGDHVRAAAARLALCHPGLDVRAACADFTQLGALEAVLPATGRRIAFFPGSTIGNFEPAAAHRFLAELGRLVGPGGALIVGVDLKKAAPVLHAAYNDRRGITARFNLNLLTRINRELDGHFDLGRFGHRAFYNDGLGRVEMHLESLVEQTVTVAGHGYPFAAGETIHTENSYKYAVTEFQALAGRAGFAATACWVDAERLFSVHFLETAG